MSKGNLIHKYLPKQTDIDKILEIIQRKVLKGTHLLVEIKEIQAGYLHSSYFKDMHLYLSQNKLPSSKATIKKVETLVEKYILLDSHYYSKLTQRRKQQFLWCQKHACRQDYNPIPLKLICRTPGSYKNIFDY